MFFSGSNLLTENFSSSNRFWPIKFIILIAGIVGTFYIPGDSSFGMGKLIYILFQNDLIDYWFVFI